MNVCPLGQTHFDLSDLSVARRMCGVLSASLQLMTALYHTHNIYQTALIK
jgi:hypothetical protein